MLSLAGSFTGLPLFMFVAEVYRLSSVQRKFPRMNRSNNSCLAELAVRRCSLQRAQVQSCHPTHRSSFTDGKLPVWFRKQGEIVQGATVMSALNLITLTKNYIVNMVRISLYFIDILITTDPSLLPDLPRLSHGLTDAAVGARECP